MFSIFKKTALVIFCIVSSFYSSKAQVTQDSTKHQKNIFTLAFYKQPGKDSMVDIVDGVYRILKINKDRSIGESITEPHLSFIPAVEYSLATKLAAFS